MQLKCIDAPTSVYICDINIRNRHDVLGQGSCKHNMHADMTYVSVMYVCAYQHTKYTNILYQAYSRSGMLVVSNNDHSNPPATQSSCYTCKNPLSSNSCLFENIAMMHATLASCCGSSSCKKTGNVPSSKLLAHLVCCNNTSLLTLV